MKWIPKEGWWLARYAIHTCKQIAMWNWCNSNVMRAKHIIWMLVAARYAWDSFYIMLLLFLLICYNRLLLRVSFKCPFFYCDFGMHCWSNALFTFRILISHPCENALNVCTIKHWNACARWRNKKWREAHRKSECGFAIFWIFLYERSCGWFVERGCRKFNLFFNIIFSPGIFHIAWMVRSYQLWF